MLGIYRPSLLSRLFKALARSAFLHGCPIWGVFLFKHSSVPSVLMGTKTSNPGEQVQLMFLRGLAGVGTRAHSLSVLHEFCHHPMMHYCILLFALDARALVLHILSFPMPSPCPVRMFAISYSNVLYTT